MIVGRSTAMPGFQQPGSRDIPADLPWVNVLGVKVASISMEAAAEMVHQWCCEEVPPGGPRYLCATSVHGVIEGQRDAAFRRILNRAALVLPDGMPLVWFGRLQGCRTMQRVYGPGFMEQVLARTAGTAVRHFFYGGRPGVAADLARRMSARFPGLQVAGTYFPPFRTLTQGELEIVAATINEVCPDIVWVGLSTPKQERWIDEVRARLRAKVLVSVGAAFDYHTGRLRQAPAWVQRAGLEWLFRLVQEPRRLWRRYAANNPHFLGLAVLQLTGLAEFPVEDGGDAGLVAPRLS